MKLLMICVRELVMELIKVLHLPRPSQSLGRTFTICQINMKTTLISWLIMKVLALKSGSKLTAISRTFLQEWDPAIHYRNSNFSERKE